LQSDNHEHEQLNNDHDLRLRHNHDRRPWNSLLIGL
jgi:hypothetical protein